MTRYRLHFVGGSCFTEFILMYLAYLDESGDDGWPETASPLFVQSAIYLHHRQWKPVFEAMRLFRRQLAAEKRLPFDLELHTRELLLDKDPYHVLKIPPAERLRLLTDFCRHFATLELKCINVVIHKAAIPVTAEYNVLDTAITYLVQRLENDLRPTDDRFMIITDEGRLGKIRTTARRIQRFNPVPSKYGQEARNQEIKLLIEDPLPKRSHESYFIQFADMTAFLVQLHMLNELKAGPWANRLARYCGHKDILALLEIIKPRLNLRASSSHPLGIVCYPKK